MHAGEEVDWNAEESMDLLTQLRDRLTDDQRKMLNAIWGSYRETGHWITRKRLHHLFRDRFQVNEVQAALTDLGGCVVYEASDDQKECYALLFLGILMTDQGPDLEELCVRYLDHVRKLYDQDPDVEQVNGKQIETDLGISSEQSKLLGALIYFGRFFGRSMGGAGQPEWGATVPEDVDRLHHHADLHRYVRTRALEGYEQNVPIEENSRMQWFMRKMGRRPSDLLNPLEVASEHQMAAPELSTQDRLHVDDIDSFERVQNVSPDMVAGFLDNGFLDRTEDQVQSALEEMLGVPHHKKDWGGETNDLFTANLVVNGAR